MMKDLGVALDGFHMDTKSSSSKRRSRDRMYPSLFPSDDEDSSDSLSQNNDNFSDISDARATPPLIPGKNQLFPKREFVDHLLPEEVRWFYKHEGEKEWKPFIGYDSLRIECRFKAMASFTEEEKDTFENDVITVRGGLYEVDVNSKKCTPIYWSGDVSDIIRGIWFQESSWQPLEDNIASQVEEDHISNFLGHRLGDHSSPIKGKKPVAHKKAFTDFYIEWNSANEVFLFSESASSKFARKLGISSSGAKLRRGYLYEAVMDDKPPEISHLVFVVHGIGQKMEAGSIIKSCRDLRTRVNLLAHKLFPNLDAASHRAEFLPVEWRTRLKLDGDTVDSITPHKMVGVRTVLNSSAMDILYYTSPLYRIEITQSLQRELNRLYDMFCSRNPYFVGNGGKISIIAHSLGAVISFDIITGWNPIQLYDQYVTSVIEEEQTLADGSEALEQSLREAKKRVNDLEALLLNVHEKQSGAKLIFQIENLFCLGSPLAVFLALRGIRPSGKGTLDHIIPTSACKRLFNIYHPFDPVAYRLEPLILKHYSTIVPLTIQKYDSHKKVPYSEMKATAYAAFEGSSEKEKSCEKKDKDCTDMVSGADCSNGNSGGRESSSGANQGLTSLFAGMFKKSGKDKLASEMKSLKKLEKEAQVIESKLEELETCKKTEEEYDQTELEYRLDYQLREGGFMSSYLSLLTSHTSYWRNNDVANFILEHVHPELQKESQTEG